VRPDTRAAYQKGADLLDEHVAVSDRITGVHGARAPACVGNGAAARDGGGLALGQRPGNCLLLDAEQSACPPYGTNQICPRLALLHVVGLRQA
jgi:hypothetical protein